MRADKKAPSPVVGMRFTEKAEGESGEVVAVDTTGQQVKLKWNIGLINRWSIEEWRRRVRVTRF